MERGGGGGGAERESEKEKEKREREGKLAGARGKRGSSRRVLLGVAHGVAVRSMPESHASPQTPPPKSIYSAREYTHVWKFARRRVSVSRASRCSLRVYWCTQS